MRAEDIGQPEDWAHNLAYAASSGDEMALYTRWLTDAIMPHLNEDQGRYMALLDKVHFLSTIQSRRVLEDMKDYLPEGTNGQTILSLLRLVDRRMQDQDVELAEDDEEDDHHPTLMRWSLWFPVQDPFEAVIRDMQAQTVVESQSAAGTDGLSMRQKTVRDLKLLHRIFSIATNIMIPMVAIDPLVQDEGRKEALAALQLNATDLGCMDQERFGLSTAPAQDIPHLFLEFKEQKAKLDAIYERLSTVEAYVVSVEVALGSSDLFRRATSRFLRAYYRYVLRKAGQSMQSPFHQGMYRPSRNTSPEAGGAYMNNDLTTCKTEEVHCPICREDLDKYEEDNTPDLVQVPSVFAPCCRKPFHVGCLFMWMRQTMGNTLKWSCPHCRNAEDDESSAELLELRARQLNTL